MKLRFTKRATKISRQRQPYSRVESGGGQARRSVHPPQLTKSGFVSPYWQRAEAARVRKLVAPHYSYLVYYTIDEAAEAITIISVKHYAQRREHEDS